MGRLRLILRAALFGSLPGLVLAAAMMYIAWEHNSQGEIHEGGVIYWKYWLLLGASWFVPVWLAGTGVAAAVLGAWRDSREPGSDVAAG